MKKYLLLSAFTIVLFSNSMFSQSEFNSSLTDLKDQNSEQFFRQMEDSIYLKSLPQNLTTLMTDNSEVRLDSTLIVDSNFFSKNKTIYNEEGQVIQIRRYFRLDDIQYANENAVGLDSQAVTLTINADDWILAGTNPSSVIQSFSMLTDGVEYGCSWYEAILTISGGILDGQTIQGCGENFNGLDITGFSSITLTSVDIDNYVDNLYMSIQIQNSYSLDEPFQLGQIRLYDYDENGNQILDEQTSYDWWEIGGDNITGYQKVEYTYNEDNRILTYQVNDWDYENEIIYLSLDQERFYDDDGNYILGQQFFYNPDGSISYAEKYEFFRDDQDRRVFRVHSVWDEGSEFFLVNDESEYGYFDNFNWLVELNFNGSVSLDNSSPSYKNITATEGDNTITTSYSWSSENEIYNPTGRNEVIRTYYENEILESYLQTQSNWDNETNNFFIFSISSYNYDEAGNRTYRRSEYLNTDNNNLYIGIEEVNEYDENNNLIMSRSNSYDYTTNDFLSAFLRNYTFEENGFLSERLYSNIFTDFTTGSEVTDPFYKEVYSTILDNNTNFIRMGTPFTYNNGNWEEYVGADFKSYYYYTKTSSLTQGENSLTSLDLFPNPTNSILQLNSDINHQMVVYDLIGRKLMEKTGNSIDISSLPNSTYIVKVTDLASDETFSKKIIKE